MLVFRGVYLDPCGFKTLPGGQRTSPLRWTAFLPAARISRKPWDPRPMSWRRRWKGLECGAMRAFKRKELAEEVFEDSGMFFFKWEELMGELFLKNMRNLCLRGVVLDIFVDLINAYQTWPAFRRMTWAFCQDVCESVVLRILLNINRHFDTFLPSFKWVFFCPFVKWSWLDSQCVSQIQTLPPWKLIYHLKNDGWKDAFPIKIVPFEGTC